MVVYTTGGAMNTTALNFAAQSIISCMFSAQLAWIAILSHFVLKEKLALKDVAAIAIIAVGIVMVVLFGPSTDSDEELTIDVLRDYFQQIPYIITVSILSLITLGIFVAVKYEEKENSKEIKKRPGETPHITKAPKFMLFGFVFISTFFASNNTLFTKACVSLAASSFESKANFETNLEDPLSYLMALLWPTCMLCMEYFRQRALSLFGAIYVVPLFSVLDIILTSVLGMIYFEEYVGFAAVDAVLFSVGILVVIAGVLVLSLDIGKLWDELYNEHLKTAFIDPDECDYKFPKTVAFGGPASEWFAMKSFASTKMTLRGLSSDLAKMIEDDDDGKGGGDQEAGAQDDGDGTDLNAETSKQEDVEHAVMEMGAGGTAADV